jgi:hypothetical protein
VVGVVPLCAQKEIASLLLRRLLGVQLGGDAGAVSVN